jgi:hypothetical protein
MMAHWKRVGGSGAAHSMFVNGLGAVATGITLLVVLVAKFTEGAWVSALLIVVMLSIMLWVRRHYASVAAEARSRVPLAVREPHPPIVIVPIQQWDRIARNALEFALTLSTEITAVHVMTEGEESDLQREWGRMVESPLTDVGVAPPKLVLLPSPYRFVALPICDYVLKVEADNPRRRVAVIVPELVERHWYHYPMHNKRAEILKWLILLKGSERIVIINVPWYIKA